MTLSLSLSVQSNTLYPLIKEAPISKDYFLSASSLELTRHTYLSLREHCQVELCESY